MKIRILGVLVCAMPVLMAWSAEGRAAPADRTLGSAAPPCGDTWTATNPLPPVDSVGTLLWTGTQIVGLGSNPLTDAEFLVTSGDGVTWTQGPLWTDPRLWAITWDGTKFVGVGPNGAIATSPDGAQWSPRTSGTSSALIAVAWTGSLLVAVGDNGTIVTSSDGQTWTLQQLAGQGSLESVAWTGSRIVVGGYMGAVYTSPDGVTWTQHTWGTWPGDSWTVDLWGMAWTAHLLVAVGSRESDGTDVIITSPDGVAWTKQVPGTDSGLAAVAWAGTEIVAVGTNGTILASADGATWTPRTSGISGTLWSVVWTGSQLVALGGAATILTSACQAPAVCAAPEVTVQPQSVVVLPGQAATLSVQASGTQPFSYQWYLGAAGDTTVPIASGTGSFTTTVPAGVSSFWVRVSNACGHVDSAAATVAVAHTVHRLLRNSP